MNVAPHPPRPLPRPLPLRPPSPTQATFNCRLSTSGVPSCAKTQKCHPVSPLPATLTHSLSRNSFPCRSYANTRGVGITQAKSLSPFFTLHSLPLSLTAFRINTYEKTGGGGGGVSCAFLPSTTPSPLAVHSSLSRGNREHAHQSHWWMRRKRKEAIRMVILKRLIVWFVETFFEAMLLALALIGLFGYDRHAIGKSFAFFVSAILLLSFTTGYLLTTAIARGAWKGQRSWSYSAIAVGLFLVHSQIFFVVSGGSPRLERLSIQVAGSCIVFACTILGSLILRKWGPGTQQLG